MSDEVKSRPGCLGFLFRLFVDKAPAKSAETFPYLLRDDFLSPAEASFYRALVPAAGDRFTVFVKVNLADVLFVTRPNENIAARNRIDRKHVDFLFCDAQTLKPVLGIELDDSSHGREDRQKRDAFVEAAFAAAGLPLLRVPVQRGYDPQELAERIADAILPKSIERPPVTAAQAAPPQQAASERLCPKCGIPMVVRTAKQGDRAGRQFLGCPNYPKCRETSPSLKT